MTRSSMWIWPHEISTIAALHFASEQGSANLRHARSLTRRIKMARSSDGHRTSVQIECPHIIEGRPADLTTKDEELGTDQRHGMVATTAVSRDASL